MSKINENLSRGTVIILFFSPAFLYFLVYCIINIIIPGITITHSNRFSTHKEYFYISEKEIYTSTGIDNLLIKLTNEINKYKENEKLRQRYIKNYNKGKGRVYYFDINRVGVKTEGDKINVNIKSRVWNFNKDSIVKIDTVNNQLLIILKAENERK